MTVDQSTSPSTEKNRVIAKNLRSEIEFKTLDLRTRAKGADREGEGKRGKERERENSERENGFWVVSRSFWLLISEREMGRERDPPPF